MDEKVKKPRPKANPITYKLNDDGAQVTFAFVDKQITEDLAKIIKNYIRHGKVPEMLDKKEIAKEGSTSVGEGVALGLHLNPLTKDYELVKIEYDAQQKTAKVVTVEFAGKLAARAYDALKIAFVKHQVIK